MHLWLLQLAIRCRCFNSSLQSPWMSLPLHPLTIECFSKKSQLRGCISYNPQGNTHTHTHAIIHTHTLSLFSPLSTSLSFSSSSHGLLSKQPKKERSAFLQGLSCGTLKDYARGKGASHKLHKHL